MEKIIRFIKHMFFPNRCMFCNRVMYYDTIICGDCEKNIPYTHGELNVPISKFCFTQLICPFFYDMGADNAVKNLKFNKLMPNARKLAIYMEQSLIEADVLDKIDIVIPVPVFQNSDDSKIFNQSEWLVIALCKLIKLPYENCTLIKHKQTKKQHKSDANERKINLIDAFSIKDTQKICGKTILLVDDVFTTGSTLECCSKTLLEAGAKEIICLTATKTISKYDYFQINDRGAEKV